jgi:hypothetical protein
LSQIQLVASYLSPPSSMQRAKSESRWTPGGQVWLGIIVAASATPTMNTNATPHTHPEAPSGSTGRRITVRRIAAPATATGTLRKSASPPNAGGIAHRVTHETTIAAAIVKTIPARNRQPPAVYAPIAPDGEIGSARGARGWNSSRRRDLRYCIRDPSVGGAGTDPW